MSLSKRMNCKVELYGKFETENRYGQKDYEYRLIKGLWAEILPKNGVLRDYAGETQYVEHSHVITIRPHRNIKLTNDMYFMFKNQRYDIKYYNPNYKLRDRIEIFCSLVVE